MSSGGTYPRSGRSVALAVLDDNGRQCWAQPAAHTMSLDAESTGEIRPHERLGGGGWLKVPSHKVPFLPGSSPWDKPRQRQMHELGRHRSETDVLSNCH